jgi:two-component system, NtrC family, response regulator AtoC
MPSRQSLLVVDDEQTMRDWLQAALAGRYDVRVAGDGAAALAALARAPADIVLSDVRMPGRDGLALLADLQAREEPGPLVLMMTAFGTIQEAVEATKRGAFAYLTKPFSLEQLDHALGRAFEYLQLREENRSLRRNVRTRREHWGLLGSSAAMHDLREKIAMIADARGTVLLQGESGTGKEVAARAIHLAGGRRNSAFIRINCAAIPETLLESELFGYERGAFTGAVQARKGKFELADGGTLLLDEISEMPFAMQAKLLRVLQEREFVRLGAKCATKIDVRIIATTNRNLREEIQEKRFREDLFFRLNVIPLFLAPLRERREDIPLLAQHFVEGVCAENGKPLMTITESAMTSLTRLEWPGNVRQLQNIIERAVIMNSGIALNESLLDLADGMDPCCRRDAEILPTDLTLADMERELILRKLRQTGGNRTQSARALGISVRTLRNKLHLYNAMGVTAPRC